MAAITSRYVIALKKMAGPMPHKLTITAPILGPTRDGELQRIQTHGLDELRARHECRHEGLPRSHLKSAGDAADEDQRDDAPRGEAVADVEQQCKGRGPARGCVTMRISRAADDRQGRRPPV
jgi:hypothetical protein